MLKWKPDWPAAKANLTRWWNGQGLAVCLLVGRKQARDGLAPPPPQPDIRLQWIDVDYRLRKDEYQLACTDFLLEAFPFLDTKMGPGSLGTFLGATPHFAETTVWYEPCIADPEGFEPIRFDPRGEWYLRHMALIEAAVARADGRYLVGIPDLIEGLDTLAALRGSQMLLADLLDRPAWVHRRLEEINEAYFAAFDPMHERVKDADGGNAFAAFHIWGPGKTAKVQCDFCCMISPAMFREFVSPYLSAQCDRLDYSLYHLDGPGAVRHLDALLEIRSLNAIQWVPGAGHPTGGNACWYDLYRRIRAGGKAVQAFNVKADEVRPLIEAVGPSGLFISTRCHGPAEADRLIDDLRQYRT